MVIYLNEIPITTILVREVAYINVDAFFRDLRVQKVDQPDFISEKFMEDLVDNAYSVDRYVEPAAFIQITNQLPDRYLTEAQRQLLSESLGEAIERQWSKHPYPTPLWRWRTSQARWGGIPVYGEDFISKDPDNQARPGTDRQIYVGKVPQLAEVTVLGEVNE